MTRAGPVRAVRLAPLYVPGDRPDRFRSALAASPDVIVDLEDAVAPSAKEAARAAVVELVADAGCTAVEVRVNAVGSGWGAADLDALAGRPGLGSVRIPKVQAPADVLSVVGRLGGSTGPRHPLPGGGTSLHLLIEDARGVEAAYDLARAHPAVAGIGLGEADLRSDLGVTDDAGLAWARGRIVVAARAAGLPPPHLGAYPHVWDLDGLATSCRAGRQLGFVGRAAIHPRQLQVIVDAFAPSPREVGDARELLAASAAGERAEHGVVVLPDGRMVDAAMLGAARRVLDLDAAVAEYRDR